MSVRLIIFDLDGTLVDTSRDLTNAVNHAVAPSGAGPFAVETVLSWVGEGITRLMEKAVQSSDEAVVGRARDRFLDYYTKHLTDFSRPYPGVPETLETLGRVRKAVLSNKRESLSVRLLEDLGLARHFELIAGSDTFGRKKPSPVPVFGIMERLNAAPDETVIVGDSRYDIEAARGAGVRMVAVSYGFRPVQTLAEADYIINGIQELVPLFISHSDLLDRRRETRYEIPDVFGSYIDMKVRIAEEYYPVTLLNFSAHGFRIEGPVPLDIGTRREFQISAPRSLSKTLVVTAVVRYAGERENTFVAGTEIESVDDELWFRIFCSTLKFITERSGSVY